MRLGIDFIAERAFMIRDHTYFKASILHRGQMVTGSPGRDDYAVNTTVLKGKIFAGIARNARYRSVPVPAFQGIPSSMVSLTGYQRGDSVAIMVETNVFLDQGFLTSYGCIRIYDDKGNSLETPLAVPGIPIHWPKRGTFTIHISDIVDTFQKKYGNKTAAC